MIIFSGFIIIKIYSQRLAGYPFLRGIMEDLEKLYSQIDAVAAFWLKVKR